MLASTVTTAILDWPLCFRVFSDFFFFFNRAMIISLVSSTSNILHVMPGDGGRC